MEIKGQVMYMGPTIPEAGLGFNKTWLEGVSDPNVYKVIESCPAAAELFVPVGEIAPVLRELNFDYAHNMKGKVGRYVTFYLAVQQWIARTKEAANQPPRKK